MLVSNTIDVLFVGYNIEISVIFLFYWKDSVPSPGT